MPQRSAESAVLLYCHHADPGRVHPCNALTPTEPLLHRGGQSWHCWPLSCAVTGSAVQGGCGLQLGGRLQQYTSCNTLQGAGAGYNLLWTLQPPSADGMSVLDLAIEAPSTGWVGWGIPSTPGEMVGASAIIVQANPAAPTGLQPGPGLSGHLHVLSHMLVGCCPGLQAPLLLCHGWSGCTLVLWPL